LGGIWEGFGRDGGFWEGFGRDGRFWVGFGRDLGGMEDFGKILGGIWEGFGRTPPPGATTPPSRRCAFGAQVSNQTLGRWRKELDARKIYKKSKGKMIDGKMRRKWIPYRPLTKDEIAERKSVFGALLGTTTGADWRRKADMEMLEKVDKLTEEQERQAMCRRSRAKG
jgi:hypothetical protein